MELAFCFENRLVLVVESQLAFFGNMGCFCILKCWLFLFPNKNLHRIEETYFKFVDVFDHRIKSYGALVRQNRNIRTKTPPVGIFDVKNHRVQTPEMTETLFAKTELITNRTNNEPN